MKRLLSVARSFLFSPAEAADACARGDVWKEALALYGILAVLQLASAMFDPLAFLDPNAPVQPPHTLGFWAAVAFWEPVIMAMSVWFTVLLTDWMSEGWLPLRTAGATLWAATPAALSLYYGSSQALGKGWYIALLALWLVPSILLTRRVRPERWRMVGTFLLGLSALQVVGVVVEFAVVVPSHSKNAFYLYSAVMLVWVAAWFAAGMRRMQVTGSAARAALAFIFALLASTVVPPLAYLLGLMPKEVLKVMLYV